MSHQVFYLKKFLIFLFIPFMAFSMHERQNSSPKVVVIGAGIAGLTTAYRLQQQGVDVEIYDAHPRVGGRILSVQINDKIGELGGENLLDGGEAENLFRLINEFNLEVLSEVFSLKLAYFNRLLA